jgi:hypothetical protein
MIRRVPSNCMPLALVLLAAVTVVTTPCVASEEDGHDPGFVVNRSELQVDDIKPGDDDQPTIGGRRHSQVSDLTAPGVIPPEAVTTREPSPEPSTPLGVLQTWIETIRAIAARIEKSTLR